MELGLVDSLGPVMFTGTELVFPQTGTSAKIKSSQIKWPILRSAKWQGETTEVLEV